MQKILADLFTQTGGLTFQSDAATAGQSETNSPKVEKLYGSALDRAAQKQVRNFSEQTTEFD